MASDYWPNLYDDPYAVKRIEKSLELADIRPGMSVLDVGCHLGELEAFMPVEVMYTGIDVLNGHNIDGGFNLGKKFDRILCLETLEHLLRPRSTLESICSHLLPDGLLVLSLPNEATIFHRIRCLLGTVDAECFSDQGKHLHLPSLRGCRELIKESHLQVEAEEYYVSPQAVGSRQAWLGGILSLIPTPIHEFLAKSLPSLFSRGFIFVCKLP